MSSSATPACTVKAHRPRWYVPIGRRYMNASAFNGYHVTSSDYSDVACPLRHREDGLGPGIRLWRTKAAYVASLPERAYSSQPEEA